MDIKYGANSSLSASFPTYNPGRCESIQAMYSELGLTVTASTSIELHKEIKPNGRRDATASEEGLAARMKEARRCEFPTALRGR